MYAIIKTSGKQYRVTVSRTLTVDRMNDADVGSTVTLDQVLMIGQGEEVTIGTPTVEGAAVTAEVLEHTRGEKIIVFKKRRRKNSRRRNGHRQDLTVLRVTGIAGPDGVAVSADAEAPAAVEPAAATPEPAPEVDVPASQED